MPNIEIKVDLGTISHEVPLLLR